MDWKGRIWLPLDGMGLTKALGVVSKFGDRVGYKLNDLWDSAGAQGLEDLRRKCAAWTWVDAKLKDIPQTVANRVSAIAEAGADFVTVMADGGIEMMIAAREAARKARGSGIPALKVIAVTVLTSLSEEEAHLLYGQPARAAALNLARMAKLAGIQYIVCSPQEVGVLAKRPELAGMIYITPGVRPVGSNTDDQKRHDTPVNAIKSGARDLVIGRPILIADDPISALNGILNEIAAA